MNASHHECRMCKQGRFKTSLGLGLKTEAHGVYIHVGMVHIWDEIPLPLCPALMEGPGEYPLCGFFLILGLEVRILVHSPVLLMNMAHTKISQ